MAIRGRADVNGSVIVDEEADEDTDVEMTTDMVNHRAEIEILIKRRERQ